MDYSIPMQVEDYYLGMSKTVHMSYKGPIDDKILQAMGVYIEELLIEHPTAARRVFRVFVELAQNISFYSAERNIFNREKKDVGVGSLFVEELENSYKFVTANLVKNEDIDSITDKVELINSLSREELREYKREQRRLPFGKKGGANIGLIQISLTSQNPLDLEIKPVDNDHSFFSIGVKIDK